MFFVQCYKKIDEQQNYVSNKKLIVSQLFQDETGFL